MLVMLALLIPLPWILLDAIPLRLSVGLGRVLDGDTLEVRRGGGVWRVRLRGVDAPEKGQPARLGGDAGAFARTCLVSALQGKDWQLEWVGRDRYGRVLAELWDGRDPLGDTLLERGCVVPYPHAGDGLVRAAQRRRALERARRARRGLWGRGGFEDPYQWRRRQKTRRRPVAKE